MLPRVESQGRDAVAARLSALLAPHGIVSTSDPWHPRVSWRPQRSCFTTRRSSFPLTARRSSPRPRAEFERHSSATSTHAILFLTKCANSGVLSGNYISPAVGVCSSRRQTLAPSMRSWGLAITCIIVGSSVALDTDLPRSWCLKVAERTQGPRWLIGCSRPGVAKRIVSPGGTLNCEQWASPAAVSPSGPKLPPTSFRLTHWCRRASFRGHRPRQRQCPHAAERLTV